MGLFDNIFKKTNNKIGSFNNEESFAGMIVAMRAVDGGISEDEIEDLKIMISKSKTLSTLNEYDYSKIIKKVFRVLKTKGVYPLLDLSIKGLSKELYEGVFVAVCDLAYSDGYIENEGRNMIKKIQIAFGITDEKALAIVNVIVVKNNI